MRDNESKQEQGEQEEIINENETETEEVDVVEEEAYADDKIKDLRKKLKVCEEEKRGVLEDLQRTKADFLNSKRRLAEQLERDKERAAEGFIHELLPLVDSFDMAFTDTKTWDAADPKWKQGIEAIYNQLMSLLRSYKVTEIESLGKPFDPMRHEAMSNQPVAKKEQVDTVVAVLQKGFERDGTIIRPARVIVGVAE